MKYLFGPVNSRRLGISLGIDLVSFKTCTLDCVYCECGTTTELTAETDAYVPVNDVLREVDAYLTNDPNLDVITFSGSGEPTLHCGIGDIIAHLKEKYPQYKVAVLTNGTLLWKEKVRTSIKDADIVIPSLDAVSEDVFEKIVRPAPDITASKVVRGLLDFRKEFAGKLILEIFFIPGLNDTDTELKLLKEVCKELKPDEIQLNSLDRPGTEEWVKPMSAERLLFIKDFFKPIEAAIIGKPAQVHSIDEMKLSMEEVIISTLRRRPSTIEDLLVISGIKKMKLQKVLNDLMERGDVIVKKEERGVFYLLKQDS